MSPTEMLKEEHRIVERVLKVLTIAAQKLERGEEVDTAVFARALDFIRNFADKCHHSKEENCLFPRIEARGIPRHGGPVGVMLSEHEMGRGHVRNLVQALEALEKGDASAKAAVARNAHGYVQVLSNHIPKEDNILYPMAEDLFTEQDCQELLAGFEKVEEAMGEGVHEKYHHLVEELEKETGISSSPSH